MAKIMKAAVLKAPKTLVVEEVPVLEVGPKDVLLKVKYCALCGSDLHNYFGEPFKDGQIMGHEFVGEVVEVGSEVADIKVGMRGTGFSMKTCGECHFCKQGRLNLCPDLFNNYTGYGLPGGFAEYIHIADAKLGMNFFEIPEDFSDEVAALIEPTGVAAHVVSRTKPKPGSNIIIQGGGPLGNLVAQVMKTTEPNSIVVTDVFDERLAYATACGATGVINAKDDVLTEYKKLLGEQRYAQGVSGAADLVVEASGNPKAIGLSFELARSGATICQVGISNREVPIDIGLINAKSLTYFGFTACNMPKAIKMISSGLVTPEKIITHKFALSDINLAFETMQNDPTAMKILIDMSL